MTQIRKGSPTCSQPYPPPTNHLPTQISAFRRNAKSPLALSPTHLLPQALAYILPNSEKPRRKCSWHLSLRALISLAWFKLIPHEDHARTQTGYTFPQHRQRQDLQLAFRESVSKHLQKPRLALGALVLQKRCLQYRTMSLSSLCSPLPPREEIHILKVRRFF